MDRLKTYRLKELDDTGLDRICRRPRIDLESLVTKVRPILEDVRRDGDAAIRRYTKKFDGIDLRDIVVDPESLDVTLPDEEKHALDIAMRNVHRFHREQMSMNLEVETMPGVTCSRVIRPIEKVGLYVPGGSAPLPSTAVMLGVPALTAGCETIILATPPDRNGSVPPAIAYVAQKIGAKKILLAGGAQAIAALAWGSESVPGVDKLFGPGNQYVTAAKMLLQNSEAMVSIDLPAGPSELLIIADETADPDFVAADLLSQAEHGPDSQVVLAAVSGFDLEELETALERQLGELPRVSIATDALAHSFIVLADRVEEALDFSNRYAPEHLILNCRNAVELMDRVEHAGSVFLGGWTPESLGDYASGTNHTLPTYGYARMYSGVSLSSFQKSITFQEATPDGLKHIGPTVETLAGMEGLDAHRLAVSRRLEKLNNG
ncbi:MAG: histidinol dehydrogenase [Balneolaceae bacterium]